MSLTDFEHPLILDGGGDEGRPLKPVASGLRLVPPSLFKEPSVCIIIKAIIPTIVIYTT